MDEFSREIKAEKECILATLKALKEAMERKERTIVELALSLLSFTMYTIERKTTGG